MLNGTAIVVSPLIALMKDQVDDCTARGIPATYINSHVDEFDQEDRLEGLTEGKYKVFYIAPERIKNKAFMEALGWADVSLLVVDEAHCASRWGHDFRPMYNRIHLIIDKLEKNGNRPPIIAVTATATSDIEDDIATSIGMVEGYKRFVADPIRPNLTYRIKRGNPWHLMGNEADTWDTANGRHIVYVGTRNGSERVASMIRDRLGLEEDDKQVGVYHAGFDKRTREGIQNRFKEGKTPIVVATCAFGMGIDIPNIRNVVHFGIPGSLEDYVQETGRAGRDGKQSNITLLVDTPLDEDRSVSLRQFFIDCQNPPSENFELIWQWLHAELDEGETLRKSAAVVAKEVADFALTIGKGYVKIPDSAVNGVLQTMESYGLVTRQYADSATTIVADVKALREWAEGEIEDGTDELALYLWNSFVKSYVTDGVEHTTFYIDRATVAGEVGCGDATLRKRLKKLSEGGAIEVGRAFTGKTTRVRQWEADLGASIPKKEIEDKRKREQRRLAKMMGYVSAQDRLTFIREYFIKGL
jgi:hypothetical protein